MVLNSFSKEQSLQQIADMLLLNGTLTECQGLVHGKMGIAVFFFHYAKYTGNELFADYAMDLMGEMMNQIHVNSPADYEKGLAGIGVGINYLIRNDFLKVEDDICEDFDGRMFRAVMYDPWQDFSQYDGLIGYGRYWMTRLRYPAAAAQARECLLYIIRKINEQLPDISILEQTDVYCFLYDVCQIQGFDIDDIDVGARHALPLRQYRQYLEQSRREWDIQSMIDFSRLGNSSVGNIVRKVHQCRYFGYDLYDGRDLHEEIDASLKQIPDLDMEKPPSSTGLLTGYAGEGLLRLTALNQANTSWMQLL